MSSFSVSTGTISSERTHGNEEEQNQLIALTMFLYKFIYRLGHLEMTTPQTLSVVNQAVAHFLTFPDPNIDDKLVIVAEKLMRNRFLKTERRVRRLHVLGRLLRENPATATIHRFF